MKKAFLFASNAHKDHKRKSWEPYIIHPLHAALHLTRIEADEKTIIWALLHDVLDNEKISIEMIQKDFWQEITKLAVGAYNLWKIYYRVDMTPVEVEILKKNLVSAGDDIRIFLIKIAERLHNLETLHFLPKEKRYRIAKESEEIYLPILNFLSIGEFMSEFNELCFQYIDEKQYKKLSKIFWKNKQKYEEIIIRAYEKISQELNKSHIRYKISSRVKSLHSIYRKIEGRNIAVDNIYDFLALRILCDNFEDCYRVLWHIHRLFRLREDKFKDYISMPKENGYQSIHTTVYDHEGNMLEFQIQTYDMFQLNKTWLAAHFMYKWFGLELHTLPDWMKGILDIQKNSLDAKWFLHRLRQEVLITDIKCYDENGKSFLLPKKSTIFDFLYEKCWEHWFFFSQIFVNGKEIDNIFWELSNGDVVRIILWDTIYSNYKIHELSKIKTQKAKEWLIQFLKKYQKYFLLEWGKNILDTELSEHTWKDFSLLPEKIQRSVIKKLWLYDQWQLYYQVATQEIDILKVVEYIQEFSSIQDISREMSFKIITKMGDTRIVGNILQMLHQLMIGVKKISYNNKRWMIYLDIFMWVGENYDEFIHELKRLPNVAEVYRIFPSKLRWNCLFLSILLALIFWNIYFLDVFIFGTPWLFVGVVMLIFWLILMRIITKRVFHYFYRLKRWLYFIFWINSLAFLSVFFALIHWQIYSSSIIWFSFWAFFIFFLLFYNIFSTYSLYYKNK